MIHINQRGDISGMIMFICIHVYMYACIYVYMYVCRCYRIKRDNLLYYTLKTKCAIFDDLCSPIPTSTKGNQQGSTDEVGARLTTSACVLDI